MRNTRTAPLPYGWQRPGVSPHWIQADRLHAATQLAPSFGGWQRISFAMVVLLAFFIPWGDMVVLPYEIQASRVFTLAAAAAWLLHLKAGHPMRPLQFSHRMLALFVLWALANVVWTVEPERAARRALSYCQLFLDLWVVYQCSATVRHYRRLLGAYLLGCGVAFSGLVYNFLIGEFQGDGRYTAPGFDPNDLACTLILGIPAAYYLSSSGPRRSWISWLYIPCAVLASLLTASRGALVALAICVIAPPILTSKLSLRAILSFIIVTVISGGLLMFFWNEISFRRLSTIGEQLATRDLNGRVDIWERGFAAFLEHPVMGVGGGGFGSAVGSRNRELAAHNTALGVLVEHGLIGLMLFSGAMLSLIARNWRRQWLEEKIWTVTLAGWTVAATTLSWENREITWLLWGLCSGAIALQDAAKARLGGARHA